MLQALGVAVRGLTSRLSRAAPSRERYIGPSSPASLLVVSKVDVICTRRSTLPRPTTDLHADGTWSVH